MPDTATARRIPPNEFPEPYLAKKRPANAIPDADRLLHLITREAFTMTTDEQKLVLALMKAMRSLAAESSSIQIAAQ